MDKLIKKVSTALAIATAVSLSSAGILIPFTAHGLTVADLEAQIAALMAQLNALKSEQSGGAAGAPASLLSSGNLTLGSRGAAVKDLQMYLNSSGYKVADSGAGSPGNETEFFGGLTKAALAKWQAANGVSPALGFFGPLTRAKLSSLGAAPAPSPTPSPTPTPTPAPGPTPTPTPAPAPAGTGLTVTLASDQPAPALAPFNATRIPFTKLQLTASSNGDVTLTALTVERQGLSEDAALAGVVLLDENGIQLGLEKTLNSDHRASVGESMTIKAGQTKTVTVAGRRAASGSRGGQTVTLSLVGVSTSANVNATFPLAGTTHTINETLTVGTLTNPTAGPLDPGASQTKEIGTKSYTFSSVRVTAGSAERVYLKSVRWNQTGSAASGDLENVKTYVDGTAYDVTVSADGKFFTSVFGDKGILIDKGFNKELSIKGDVKGGSARKVDFDIDKRSDLYAVGETYGYGILSANGTDTSGTDDGAFHQDSNPWWDAYEVHISSGTMTVTKWNSVTAQNIAVNLADQPISGWAIDVKGEAISVGQMVFHVDTTESSGGAVGLDDLDSVKLVDESGKTLAGPIDPSATTADGNITFTDTITFPVGVTNLKMLAKLATDWANNDTVAASTTPSTSWTSVTGQSTGNTITPSPTSAVAGNTMTVKTAALTISVSSVPIAQTVIAGTTQFEFAKYILDSTASGEDLRLTSLPIEYNLGAGAGATDLTNCKIYEGGTALTTGSNVVNPSAAASSTAFTFDGTGLTLVKGSAKTLSLKCDIRAAATANGTFSWGYDSTASPSPTGLTSGQSVASADLVENDSAGQSMTVAATGSLTVALDTAAPYLLASPGQTVELLKLKYTATNETVDVKSVALQLTGVASNTPVNLEGQTVTLWDGATKVGEAVFSSGDTATSTLTGLFRVPKDGSKVLTVKGSISGISSAGPQVRSGDFLRIDYDGNNEGTSSYTGGNYGTGMQSGQQVNPSTSDTSSTGVRVMKAYPSVAKVDLSSSERVLQNGTRNVYKFKVTANQGEVALAKFSFTVSSSTLSATSSTFALYAYTDSSFSVADSQLVTSGLFNAGSCYSGQTSNTASARGHLVELYPDATGCNQATTTFKISSGESRWFRLQASLSSVVSGNTSETLNVQLDGDSAFPTAQQESGDTGDMGTAGIGSETGVEDASDNDFLWSPRSTSTTAALGDLDWTNGYGVVGLPGTNLDVETLSK